ncbi:exonuclease subunit SbcD [Endozoicomonas sp. GU-1]|uniref:exonuclease subunit SbcD n=1 Tax=Endozoicomonas sp. GU-1 TaxID=3009078 RepID=UPI0022B40FBC|nr:exonuclease subunit SbcD [Endozoicomonas sp. GU-1]WBA81400.1 exonuclease subunit SbcD [Endozoicomonas sp. GU-1]WBA84348.1 exonuclease subunit SbcD [Endozoicomonas sp. GU-1]
MRILHTSDWHLGQHFMGKSREAEHQAFLDWLIELVQEQRIDALIIAGDIFDTGTPPSYARGLYSRFIVSLQNTHCRQLIVIGGNHDSVATLNESKELLACLNTFVVGGVSQDSREQVLVLNNAQGKPGAVICAIPFVRPRDVLESQAGETGEDKQQALQQAIAAHYQTIYTEAEKLAGERLPIIATGHLTTVGGQLSESVREIYIGTLSAFPVAAFPKAHYIALGHLHRPQVVAKQEHIRYSGSPIPLSFDEAGSDKQVIIVDFRENELNNIESVIVPVFRPLISLKGSLDSIDQQLATLASERANENEQPQAELNPWLEIEITTEAYLHDLQSRVEQMVLAKEELSSFELLRVRRKREKAAASLTVADQESLAELNVEDVFQQRLKQEELTDEQLQQLTGAFQEILEDVFAADKEHPMLAQHGQKDNA